MGCDIHLWVEVRRDGAWCPEPVPPRWDPWNEKHQLGSTSWYPERAYHTFAMLADVRNYAGLTPIAAPRGMPPDPSPFYANEVEDWGADGHSHSWFTLAELQAFDWDREHSDAKGTRSYRTMQYLLADRIMATMAELGAPDDVRIVFFFDN